MKAELLSLMVISHVVGDFVLQNNWMQRKSQSTFVCLVHVLVYCLPFVFNGVPLAIIAAVFVQHFLQDRFALHLRWMKLYSQTPPEKWPQGPLFVDQALHLTFFIPFLSLA